LFEINDLNEFLKEDAIKQSKQMLNTTYTVIYNKKLIAFYTLSVDSIAAKNIPKNYKKFNEENIAYKSYPALKLGRLGVQQNNNNKGLGTFILKRVFKLGISLSKCVGLRFITIDAYMSSYRFYEKNHCEHAFNKEKVRNKLKEYETLKSQNNKRADDLTIPMFYDLARFNQI